MNDPKELERNARRLINEVERIAYNELPRQVGTAAVNMFKDNFRKGGFVNGGLHPWQRTRRQEGEGTHARFTPLTSEQNHLMRSVQFQPGRGEVLIYNPVEYAAIHNEGGDITVTAKMHRYAWYKFYSMAGIKKGEKIPKEVPAEAAKWRALALTKKTKLHIPQRQFIGESAELTQKVNTLVVNALNRIAAKFPNTQ